MRKVEVLAPAKLNLALDILGLTKNGYHRVDMIMQAVSLYDRVEVAKSVGYSLRCPGSRIAANDKNTATRAAMAFFTETGLLAGADITIHKAIPTRAGLAGGSADAAAVLVGLNELYGARLSLAELCRLGVMVGADVPFSLMGGTARAEGIGEILTPLPSLPACTFVVVMPPAGVSTVMAYSRYDELGSSVHPAIDAAVRAIEAGSLRDLKPHMHNALEETSGNETTTLLRRRLEGAGALASMMTGSGSAVFGLFEQEASARAAMKTIGADMTQVFLVQPLAGGPRVIAHI